jgi:hypothetical protein
VDEERLANMQQTKVVVENLQKVIQHTCKILISLLIFFFFTGLNTASNDTGA